MRISVISSIKLCAFFATSLLAGCTHYLTNPYDNVPPDELRQVKSSALCAVVRNSSYQVSQQVDDEVSRRGYKSCSTSEVYCMSDLSLKPGTDTFAHCMLSRDQYEFNVKTQEKNEQLALKQIRLQEETISKLDKRG